ncbi:MAG: hypothetical protein ACE5KM_04780, partial [Planctomycetaceae bacterium]
MPARKVKDIVDHIRACHARLSEQYADFGNQHTNERIRLLLAFMAQHEQSFEASLADYEHDAATGILDTWIPFVPEEALNDALEDLELHDGMDPEDVISDALALDRKLIDLYRHLASETAVPRIQE